MKDDELKILTARVIVIVTLLLWAFGLPILINFFKNIL